MVTGDGVPLLTVGWLFILITLSLLPGKSFGSDAPFTGPQTGAVQD